MRTYAGITIADCPHTYAIRFIMAARRVTVFRDTPLQAVDEAMGAITGFMAAL